MAISYTNLKLLLDLNNRGFFNNTKSVIDMGDQDLNVNYDQLKESFKQWNIKFDEFDFENSKKYPSRPRVPSSAFWRALGFKIHDRLDIEKLPRNKEIGNLIIQDLNKPLNNAENLIYDLVTDFGNNEHPFNIAESLGTMHKLCKVNGLIIINQSFFNGNGYYNFDLSFFENVAAVNNYSIKFSKLFFIKGENFVSSTINKENIKLINFNEIDNVYMFYVLEKKNNENFKFPYQGTGTQYPACEYYTETFINEAEGPSRYYLPTKSEDLSVREILKVVRKRLIG